MRTLYYNWLLDELATEFGEEAIDRLMTSFARAKLHVPKSREGQILEQLGHDIALWLSYKRGGTSIHVPSKWAVAQHRRVCAMENDISL